MAARPENPYIYHITHVNNLPNIIQEGGLWSDAEIAKGRPPTSIGISAIKQRRLKLPVKCYPHDCVGDYVPFYFCPRSIMLYLIYCANHPDLTYHNGQGPIIHLEAELCETVKWAENEGQRWAFSLSNAGTAYTEFRNTLHQLNEVDWEAVKSRDFRDQQVKEGKQAEFLVYRFYPWYLVRRIGVFTSSIRRQVLQSLTGAPHIPVVKVIPQWYY